MAANPHAMARAAGTVSILALLSPLAGLLVEMTLAWRFGAGSTMDAFRIASLLLLFSQQLFVLQILPHAIVPVFSEFSARGEHDQAWQTAFSLANLLLLPAGLLALLVMAFSQPVVRFLAPGLVGEAHQTASLLVRCFAPACALMVWSGVATGVLYAHRIFWLPPTVQIAGNIILIAAILSFGRIPGVTGLVFGVLLATGTGLALYLHQLRTLLNQAKVRLRWSIRISHPGLRKTLGLISPLLASVVLSQCSAVILNRVLSGMPAGSLAQFGYAWKLGQMVSLAPVALATVLFPRLAEVKLAADGEAFRDLCTRALRMALFLVLPLAGLVWSVREPVVAFLLQHGAFSPRATEIVGRLFGLLLLGAPAAVLTGYLEKICYASQYMWAPVPGQLLTVLVVALLASQVASRFAAEGLMVFCSVLTWTVAVGLSFWLSWKHKALALGRLAPFTAAVFLLALASSWVGGKSAGLFAELSATTFLTPALVAAGGVLIGGILFFGLALIARSPEATQLSQFLLWQGSYLVRRKPGVLGR